LVRVWPPGNQTKPITKTNKKKVHPSEDTIRASGVLEITSRAILYVFFNCTESDMQY
jgi:hypothetical protein